MFLASNKKLSKVIRLQYARLRLRMRMIEVLKFLSFTFLTHQAPLSPFSTPFSLFQTDTISATQHSELDVSVA